MPQRSNGRLIGLWLNMASKDAQSAMWFRNETSLMLPHLGPLAVTHSRAQRAAHRTSMDCMQPPALRSPGFHCTCISTPHACLLHLVVAGSSCAHLPRVVDCIQHTHAFTWELKQTRITCGPFQFDFVIPVETPHAVWELPA